MKVEWKAVPGYENYQVSNSGLVRGRSGKILSPSDSRGYQVLRLSKNAVKQGFSVHSLVLLAFVGPRPQGSVIMHLDHDKKNNHLNNLRYGTQRENVQMSIQSGNRPGGDGRNCVRGHLLIDKNLIIRKNGYTECRRCKLDSQQKWRQSRSM